MPFIVPNQLWDAYMSHLLPHMYTQHRMDTSKLLSLWSLPTSTQHYRLMLNVQFQLSSGMYKIPDQMTIWLLSDHFCWVKDCCSSLKLKESPSYIFCPWFSFLHLSGSIPPPWFQLNLNFQNESACVHLFVLRWNHLSKQNNLILCIN